LRIGTCVLIHVDKAVPGWMDSSGSNKRVIPALPDDKGIWGRAQRVVVGPEPGLEIARICPDCGEECEHRRTKFIRLHGQYADGRRKCQLRQQQPAAADAHTGTPQFPASAGAAAAAAAAAGGPDTDERADGEYSMSDKCCQTTMQCTA
jgi:hypothetical protein